MLVRPSILVSWTKSCLFGPSGFQSLKVTVSTVLIIAIAVVLEGIKCRLWSRWSSSPSRWKGGFTTLLEAYVEEGHVEGVRVEPEGVEPKKAGMARGPSSESEE